jgi:heat shock protein HslJ
MTSGIIRRSAIAIGIGLVATALTACASSGAAGGPGAPATESDLVGSWVTGETYATAPNEPYLTFSDDGSWKGSDGCNGGAGSWSVGADGAITATASGFSTLIGCEGAPLPKYLTSSRAAYLDGDSLVLADDAGETLVTLVPAPEGTVE